MSDHIRGAAHASLRVVEYGDYQCAHCGRAYPVLEALVRRYPAELSLVYRHLPLSQPYAVGAAEAAEAASAQGRFWDMHELLFEHQDELDTDSLYAYASDLGLDLDSFDIELAEHHHLARIRTDFLDGVRSGATGTSTLFINDKRYDGPIELRAMSVLLDDMLAGSAAAELR